MADPKTRSPKSVLVVVPGIHPEAAAAGLQSLSCRTIRNRLSVS
jgi:hypothetical protein